MRPGTDDGGRLYGSCLLQLKELVEQGLEGNEIIALLTWIEEYL